MAWGFIWVHRPKLVVLARKDYRTDLIPRSASGRGASLRILHRQPAVDRVENGLETTGDLKLPEDAVQEGST